MAAATSYVLVIAAIPDSPVGASRLAEPGNTDSLSGIKLVLFARMWAMAALFHLAGNGREAFSDGFPLFAIVQIGVGVTAALVLHTPQRVNRLVLLCALIPISAFLEAPVVGNHWVLAAAISMVVLGAAALSRRRGGGADASAVWAFLAPAARVSLLIAYAFAGFAKLNTDFFDPTVSCAVFYHDQLVGSWGLDALLASGRPLLGRLLAGAAATVELLVPVLLLVSRTRRVGLLLALSFHWLLAMDLGQHFWDFSAVLFAGFLLFADGAQVAGITGILRSLRADLRAPVRRVLAAAGLLGAGLVTFAAVAQPHVAVRVLAVLAGHAAWWLYGTGLLLVVARVTWTTRRTAPADTTSVRLRIRPFALYVIPLLVLFNGLTPYLEIKTGFGWNMYSNLRTVEGETNHFIVPATLDLTGLQSDRVEIIASSDEDIAALGNDGYAVAYSELLEYAQHNPEEAIIYRRGGRTYDVPRLADDPLTDSDVSWVSHRLQSFRLIDVSGSMRCQPVFSPAR